MGWFEGTWASRPRHPANLVPHLEPLEACLGLEDPLLTHKVLLRFLVCEV
jgi:hypothetical protein